MWTLCAVTMHYKLLINAHLCKCVFSYCTSSQILIEIIMKHTRLLQQQEQHVATAKLSFSFSYNLSKKTSTWPQRIKVVMCNNCSLGLVRNGFH